ncbi:MAG TPA: AbrB/MazE/SpoVT family DNA-binding domain-containing protein [Bryobacteraceae bacterium]|jgi:AbrB family looped-hinge helix DNA binding protein|nr:AbrB/MazE/SpoVT family DNA-binding domain-containing protein [Bryobacteraceae bacterium]
MALAKSKVTSQGQVSVPAAVRKKLGIVPGSTIEWEEEGDRVVVRRAGKYTFEDIRRTLFPDGPPRRASLEDMKKAIEGYIMEQHARGRY